MNQTATRGIPGDAVRSAIAVFLGASAGTGLRAVIGIYVDAVPGHVAINLVGSLLLGVLVAGLAGAHRERLRLLLGTGLLGGFTTYSAFAVDAVQLGAGGDVWGALGYVAVSVLGGLVAAALGLALGARLSARVAGRRS